jgi:CRISPR-associated endonuclease Cas1
MVERTSTAAPLTDAANWAARSEYWQGYRPTKHGAPKKFAYREPLILCGHGARLNLDHGSLLIRDGFTHYPQNQKITRLFPGDPNLPDRIVMLDGSGGISFDALAWMAEQEITFIQLNWQGEVSFISGNSGYSANRKLAEFQLRTKGTKKAVDITRKLISEKIHGSIQTISSVFPNSEKSKIAISKLENWNSKLKNPGIYSSIPKIQGAEGAAACIYYAAWHGIPLKWSGLKKRPIPDSWHEIGPRTMTWRKGSNGATHPINAMLNYGYGMAISQVRAEVIAQGLDPLIGVAHSERDKNRIPLVYDLIEPVRPVIERELLEFALGHVFEPSDFTINRFGACRINPQMAKRLVERIAFEREHIRSLVRRLVSELIH